MFTLILTLSASTFSFQSSSFINFFNHLSIGRATAILKSDTNLMKKHGSDQFFTSTTFLKHQSKKAHPIEVRSSQKQDRYQAIVFP